MFYRDAERFPQALYQLHIFVFRFDCFPGLLVYVLYDRLAYTVSVFSYNIEENINPLTDVSLFDSVSETGDLLGRM